MRARTTLLTSTLGLLLFATGCAGGVEGDWFLCEDANCLKLQTQGLRFDGTRWRVLASEGQPENGYCEVTEMTGIYELNEERLTIRSNEQSLNFLLRLDEEVMVLTDANGQTTFWLSISEQKTLPCDDNTSSSIPSGPMSQLPNPMPPSIVNSNPCEAAAQHVADCVGGQVEPGQTAECTGDTRTFAECVVANPDAFCAYVQDPNNTPSPCPY